MTVLTAPLMPEDNLHLDTTFVSAYVLSLYIERSDYMSARGQWSFVSDQNTYNEKWSRVCAQLYVSRCFMSLNTGHIFSHKYQASLSYIH